MDDIKKRALTSFLYLALISVVLVFSCIAFFGRSVAWFSTNSNVTATGMSIEMFSDDSAGISNIRVYKVDENNNSATLYENPSPTELRELLTLNEYDSVFAEKREFTPIIIKTTLENFKSGTNEAELTLNVSLNTATGFQSGGKLTSHISNFINVSYSIDGSLNDEDTDPADYYPPACEILKNSTSQTFVNYSGSGAGTIITDKSDSLTFTITKPAGKETMDVYLLLSYDENLIAKFISDYSQAIGSVDELNSYFSWGNDIEFTKDIAKIFFTESTATNSD